MRAWMRDAGRWLAAFKRGGRPAGGGSHWRARLRWHRQTLACRLGRGGRLSLAACGLLLVFGALEQETRQADLQQRRQQLSAPTPALPATAGRERQWQAQLRLALAPRKLALLEQLRQSGLSVHEASYREEAEAGGALRRVSVELSASGRYPELMAALGALTAQPLLRLEALTLDRARTDAATLSMRMRFSLLGAGQ
ncbi:GspMb/PilO family protein [Chromobacterium rhizoryzae]|uniref:GspMb/PilO family protein n=1 Tax=Chromobacterium rhizoryzae TaxID=1778675 RepID=UPI001D086DE0|nr:GspMb/PilO family protein [Chromobacterium rhizoryzae]